MRPWQRALGLAAVVAAGACDTHETPTGPPVPTSASRVDGPRTLHTSVADLLTLEVGPAVIAHRGMGPNLGEDPGRPLENTVQAARQGFKAGAPVVEVDLQMTSDGEIVMWHDDFLEDATCINSLTRDQLAERAPYIDSFQALLETAKRYNTRNPDRMTGLLTVDLKPASPLCDPSDATGPAFVARVIRTVRTANAEALIYFNSMSPVLLELAAEEAPGIPRQLTVLALQFLTPEQVEAALGLPVTIIDKTPDFGLRWAEIGPVYRLPGYESPQQAIQTAHASRSAIVSYDLRLLGQIEQAQPGGAGQLVQATRATGLAVFAGDVSTTADWWFGASLGVGALYADNVPLAVQLQPPLG